MYLVNSIVYILKSSSSKPQRFIFISIFIILNFFHASISACRPIYIRWGPSIIGRAPRYIAKLLVSLVGLLPSHVELISSNVELSFLGSMLAHIFSFMSSQIHSFSSLNYTSWLTKIVSYWVSHQITTYLLLLLSSLVYVVLKCNHRSCCQILWSVPHLVSSFSKLLGRLII